MCGVGTLDRRRAWCVDRVLTVPSLWPTVKVADEGRELQVSLTVTGLILLPGRQGSCPGSGYISRLPPLVGQSLRVGDFGVGTGHCLPFIFGDARPNRHGRTVRCDRQQQ